MCQSIDVVLWDNLTYLQECASQGLSSPQNVPPRPLAPLDGYIIWVVPTLEQSLLQRHLITRYHLCLAVKLIAQIESQYERNVPTTQLVQHHPSTQNLTHKYDDTKLEASQLP